VAAYRNSWCEKVCTTLPRTRTIFLVDARLYYDPSSGPCLRPSLAAPFRAPTFVYCKGGRTGQRYVRPSFLTPQVHSRRCGIMQHDKGQAPLANPQQGACPPPCLSRWCTNGGRAGGTPFVRKQGAARTGGAQSRRGPPFTPHPHLCTNGGHAESPLLPPLRGAGRYVPPPLAPNHTLTGKCAPPFCPGNAYALPRLCANAVRAGVMQGHGPPI
jgi:hypothetical protein